MINFTVLTALNGYKKKNPQDKSFFFFFLTLLLALILSGEAPTCLLLESIFLTEVLQMCYTQ